MAQKLYRASAGQTATVSLLLAYVALCILAYVGYGATECKRSGASAEQIGMIRNLIYASIAFAAYGLASVIKRRSTLKPLPLELPATAVSVLLAIGFCTYYYLACQRMI